MKTRKTTFVSALAIIALASLFIVPGAHAGAKYQYPVYINTFSYSGGSYTIAEGSFSDTRDSSDTTSYMTCGLNYNQGAPVTGYCNAYSATGQYAWCSTTDPAGIQVIGSMKSDSLIQFDVYSNSSTCAFISSANASYIAPK